MIIFIVESRITVELRSRLKRKPMLCHDNVLFMYLLTFFSVLRPWYFIFYKSIFTPVPCILFVQADYPVNKYANKIIYNRYHFYRAEPCEIFHLFRLAIKIKNREQVPGYLYPRLPKIYRVKSVAKVNVVSSNVSNPF